MSVPATTGGLGLRALFKAPLSIDAVWLASAPFSLVVAALLTPIRPFDYFWALVQGRAIVQLGRIPTENLFLHTLPADVPFFDQPWLGQLTMYGAFHLGGHSANLLLHAGLLVLGVLVVMDAALRLGAKPRLVAIVALAVAPLLALGAGVRTQMFAYSCFALVLRGAVLRSRQTGPWSLIRCAAVAALWSNLHGSFVLAPVIVAAVTAGALLEQPALPASRRAILGRGLRDLAVIGLATLFNPRGPMSYVYVLGLGRTMGAGGAPDVDEWLAPSVHQLAGALFYISALVGVVIIVLGRRRLSPAAVVPHLLFAILSVATQRFVPWWALSAVVAIASTGAQASAADARTGPSWPNLAMLAGFASLVLACLPGAPLFERAAVRSHLPYPEARALGLETPLRTAVRLASGYPGNLFHTQAVGGLVEWTVAGTGPKQVAFVDQRFELTPPGLWRDYFTICEARPGWRQLLERYRVGTVLADETNASGLLSVLAQEPGWRHVGREFGYHLYQRVAVPSP